MHEASLARSLVAAVARLAAAHRTLRVERVRVRVGAFSGVEPALLAAAFTRTIDGTPVAGAQLDVACVPLALRCRRCGDQREVENSGPFRCAVCGGRDVDIVAGEELVLESVDFVLRDESLEEESPSVSQIAAHAMPH